MSKKNINRNKRILSFFAHSLLTLIFVTTLKLYTMNSRAVAQEVTELPPITIFSANRSETELAKEGASVDIITREDLEKSQQTFVVDYLRQVPGISFAQSGGAGTVTNLSIRGASSSFVKVLIDGIDVSDTASPATTVSFEHLLVADVSRIEIVKGSQSIFYGSNAVGGLISITTNKALKPGLTQSVTSEYGSFNTYVGSYSIGYSGDKGDISFTAQGITTDSFSAADENAGNTEDDNYDNLTFSSRGTFRFTDTVSMFYAARTFKADTEFDDFGFDPAIGSFPTDDVIGNNTETTQRAGRVGLTFDLLDGQFKNTIAVQGVRNERDTIDGFGESKFIGERVKTEYQGLARFNEQFSLVFGTDYERTFAETNGTPNGANADIVAGYVQGTLDPIAGLTLSLGGRIDDHSEFGNFETYRATAAYQFAKYDLKIRGTIGTGFRAPSLFELFDENFGNELLEPEESESWDVGFDKHFANKRIKFSATYFELDTDKLISFVFDTETFTFKPDNVSGVTERKGVELSASAQITPKLALSAGYTYTETEQENGERLVRVPKNQFVFGVTAQPIDRLRFNANIKVVDDVVDSFFGPNGSELIALDDYVLLNAKVDYAFDNGVTAYVRGENLLDEEYQTVSGFGTSDLAVYGGLKWNWHQQDKADAREGLDSLK